MLDPRIYRTGLTLVVLSVLVLAFSLQDQPSALTSPLAPDAFNGQNVAATTAQLTRGQPPRPPGSAADQDLATQVATDMSDVSKRAFRVTTDTFTGQTADGARTLENVVAVRPGSVQAGSLVIVAHRDARGSPAAAALSGTATLIELARDLAGETLHRTVVLASTTGAQGTAGALRLAATVAGPIDAVIVLGDLASRHLRQPIVVPWSTSPNVASPVLRNTLGAELRTQASIGPTGTSLFGQYLHLAFPLTLSEQAPFGDLGVPAVLVSLTGERGPAPASAVAGADQLTAVGRGVLATLSALDSGAPVPTASPYLLLAGKVVPGWALSIFVLALIVPVLLTTIDGLARARRRGHPLWRWIVLVLAAALPFALIGVVVRLARLAGALPVAPAAPVGPGTVPTVTAGWAVVVAAALLAGGAAVALRPVVIRFALPRARSRGPGRDTATEGAVAGLLAVACVVTILLWLANPYAALLAVPGLHLWLLALSPDLRLRLPTRLGLLLAGLLPLVAVPVYYAMTLGYSPLGMVWMVTLLIAGHGISIAAVVEWSLFGGCVLSALGILVALARQPRPEQLPVTVRGPVGYAGPGSLGGTESALRR
ncbi:MAG: hypothetical protein M3022_01420 [Actinomycetota bacterium]|nr:hypothetical protein [Actinomycetota bacterium]